MTCLSLSFFIFKMQVMMVPTSANWKLNEFIFVKHSNYFILCAQKCCYTNIVMISLYFSYMSAIYSSFHVSHSYSLPFLFNWIIGLFLLTSNCSIYVKKICLMSLICWNCNTGFDLKFSGFDLKFNQKLGWKVFCLKTSCYR